jgi:phosphate transport system permease protein
MADIPVLETHGKALPNDEQFTRGLKNRHLDGAIWRNFFLLSIVAGMIALVALFATVINQAFGYVAVVNEVDPATLSDVPLEELGGGALGNILAQNANANRMRVFVRDYLVQRQIGGPELTGTPLGQLLPNATLSQALSERTLSELTAEEIGIILATNLGQQTLYDLVVSEVVGQEYVEAWSLTDSLFNKAAIDAQVAADHPDAEVFFKSWLRLDFLLEPMSSTPAQAGIRTALLGSVWLIIFTVLVAFPIGVGAAIYLEEYSSPTNRIQKLIETNIRNLAGVPSIIYGLLGLAIFVRTLEAVTQGRTLISGALTMALLILPVIIINAQEALRAVPYSIREASYGLGATKWQTIWNQVLPAAVPGILTGTILAMSRAIGETAPLIVIGAATFITFDPEGPFSQFTALPIQIYNWTARPQAQFRDIAAAAIIALLVLLLTLNATAIYLRQVFRRKLQG